MNSYMTSMRRRRKAAGLTTEELGRRVGVSAQAVGAWERGTALPSADRLPEIARALGCRIDDLYEDEPGPAADEDRATARVAPTTIF